MATKKEKTAEQLLAEATQTLGNLNVQQQGLGAGLGPQFFNPPVPAVYRQMVKAAGDFAKAGLAKDGINAQQQFKFRGIDSLMNLAAPILHRYGLLVLPMVQSRTVEARETRNGALLYNVTLDMCFQFIAAEDGSTHLVRVVGEAMDSADKASNKAMSAAYKYAMFQSFCIPVEGAMDEADQTTPEETVVAKPEGYDIVKMAAKANAVHGTKAVRDYAFSLKETPQFACWDYLVKQDKEWQDIKATAEAVDAQQRQAAIDKAAADAKQVASAVKATGLRVPGEEEG